MSKRSLSCERSVELSTTSVVRSFSTGTFTQRTRSTLPGAARGLLEFVDESLAELAPRTPLELLDEYR